MKLRLSSITEMNMQFNLRRKDLISWCFLLMSFGLFSQNRFDDFKVQIKQRLDRFEYQTALSEIQRFQPDSSGVNQRQQLSMLKADVYMAEGEYTEAKKIYSEVEKWAISNNDTYILSYADVGIADLYKYSGAYESAIQYYNHAKYVSKSQMDVDLQGRIYLGLAAVYKNVLKHSESLIEYEKALEIYEQNDGKISRGALNARLGLGNLYLYKEDYQKAIKEYGTILDITYDLDGENHEISSSSYNSLGVIYYFVGEYDASLNFFNKSLKIDQFIHGKKHPNVANDYFNISKVYFEKGDIKESLEYIQLALNSSINHGNKDNLDPYVNPSLTNYFDLKDFFWYMKFKSEILEYGFFESKNIKGLSVAYQSFLDSDSLVTKLRKSYIEEKDQLELGKMSHALYASAVEGTNNLLQLVNEKNISQLGEDITLEEAKEKYKESIFDFIEKDKGAVLSSSIDEINARKYGGVSLDMIAKEEALLKEIATLREELLLKSDPSEVFNIKEELFQKTRLKEGLIEKMELEYPEYDRLKNKVSTTELAKIQSKLDAETMMISYFLTEKEIYTLYITKNDLEIVTQKKYPNFLKEITAFRNAIIYDSKIIFTQVGRKLHTILFPKSIPESIKKIVIIPDGQLVFIPFEALLTKYSSTSTSYSDMHYLINKYSISYGYSANIWYKTQFVNFTNTDEKGKTFLGIAPLFSDKVTRGETSLHEQAEALPNSEDEVNNLETIFLKGNVRSRILVGNEANEYSLKTRDLGNVGYLHIASHGFVNQKQSELSGILFAGTSNAEDDIMYSGEIQNLHLNAYLTTLSACETGLGSLSSGEGLIGLTRSLIYAGSQNLLVSLWNLNDPCAKDFMVSFYENHINNSMSLMDATRKTKLELIKNSKYSSPYYWSPFILSGK